MTSFCSGRENCSWICVFGCCALSICGLEEIHWWWVLWWCQCAFEFRNKDIFERWVISAQLREYCLSWSCPLVYGTKHLRYLVCVLVHIFRCIIIPLEHVHLFIMYAWSNLRIVIWFVKWDMASLMKMVAFSSCG